MPGQRKRYSRELKTLVALEAIRGHKTTNEIAAEHPLLADLSAPQYIA
jgi:transposase-like protein